MKPISRYLGTIAAAWLLTAGGAVGPMLRAQPSAWIFRPGGMNEAQLVSEFQGSVVYVQVKEAADPKKECGSAFLVFKDSTGGYFLTAGHVVEAAKLDAAKQVTATFFTAAGLQLPAKVIRCVNEPLLDYALLRIDNPPATAGSSTVSPLAQLRPMDISLMPPDYGDTIYAMGFPLISPNDPTFFQEQLVNFMNLTPDGSIEVRQAIFAGNSGGPLVDATGSARGICREFVGIGATVARYVPLWQVLQLFQDLPLSDRVRQLDARLRTGSLGRDEMRATLKPNSQNPTNVELYLWAVFINAQRSAYGQATPLIRELLIPALIQRGLPDQGLALDWAASPKQTGDANLLLAKRANAYGQSLTALNYANAALAAYGTGPADAESTQATLLVANINLQLGNLQSALVSVASVTSRLSSLTDQQKGEALDLFGRISAKAGDLPKAAVAYTDASKWFLAAHNYSKAAAALDSQALLDWGAGDSEKAKVTLKRAVDLYGLENNKRGQFDSLLKLYNIQETSGQKTDAQKVLNDIASLKSEDPRMTDLIGAMSSVHLL